MELDEEDLTFYLMNGYVRKKVEIIKEKWEAVFRTLTSDEYSKIEDVLAEKITEKTFHREMQHKRTKLMFAFCLEKMGPPGALVEASGEVDERYEVIGKTVGPAVLNILSEKYNLLEFAVVDAFKKGSTLKNS